MALALQRRPREILEVEEITRKKLKWDRAQCK